MFFIEGWQSWFSKVLHVLLDEILTGSALTKHIYYIMITHSYLTHLFDVLSVINTCSKPGVMRECELKCCSLFGSMKVKQVMQICHNNQTFLNCVYKKDAAIFCQNILYWGRHKMF